MDERRGGYITIKAVHVWGPFIFQLVMLAGAWFRLEQKVSDLSSQVDRLNSEIVELRTHVWK